MRALAFGRRLTSDGSRPGDRMSGIAAAALRSDRGRLVRKAVDQLLRRPSAARFHCATLSAIMRVDFIAAWLSWA